MISSRLRSIRLTTAKRQDLRLPNTDVIPARTDFRFVNALSIAPRFQRTAMMRATRLREYAGTPGSRTAHGSRCSDEQR